MGNPGPQQEISLISYPAVLDISEIKLIRTDTTLDLGQKAEKVCKISGCGNHTEGWGSVLVAGGRENPVGGVHPPPMVAWV